MAILLVKKLYKPSTYRYILVCTIYIIVYRYIPVHTGTYLYVPKTLISYHWSGFQMYYSTLWVDFNLKCQPFILHLVTQHSSFHLGVELIVGSSCHSGLEIMIQWSWLGCQADSDCIWWCCILYTSSMSNLWYTISTKHQYCKFLDSLPAWVSSSSCQCVTLLTWRLAGCSAIQVSSSSFKLTTYDIVYFIQWNIYNTLWHCGTAWALENGAAQADSAWAWRPDLDSDDTLSEAGLRLPEYMDIVP